MLIRVCIAVLLGLVAAQLEPVPMQPTQLLFAAVVAAVGALLARGRAGPRELGWMCCAGALGGLHGTLHGTRPPSTPVIDAPVVVQGTLISQPQLGQRLSRARARLDDSGSPAGQSAGPPVVIVDRPDGLLGQLAVGDRIQAEGRLRQTEPRGPLAMPFPRLRLLDQPADGPVPFATRLRGAAERAIQARLPEPQAGLATGVLLGGSAGLTADMRQALRRSGLAHLVVIDGYKQVLVAGLVESVAVRLLGRRLAWLPVLVGIVGYTLLSGGHASAVRAGLMVGFSSLAAALGRVPDPLSGLALAALLMAGIQPSVLLDVGFQLSCSATLGLILLWPRVRRKLRGLPRPIAEPAGLTLAVTLATLPVSLSVFEEVSLISPIAHIVAVPLLPPVMLGAGLLAATSSLPGLGVAGAWLAWLPTSLLAQATLLFGDLPGAALSTGRLAPAAAAALGAALLAWSAWWLPECDSLRRRLTRLRLIGQPCVAPLTALCSAALAACLLLITRPDGQLHVEPIAAGSGQAMFIRASTGRTALVVHGALDGTELTDQVAAHLHLWEHSLDTVVVLEPALSAGRLEPTLQRYPAEQVVHATGPTRLDFGGAALDLQVAADGLTIRSAPTTFEATRVQPD